MFKAVKRDDAIFCSDAFVKDEIPYSIMASILNNAERYTAPRCFSDGKDCAIVNSDPHHGILVWTADDFQEYGRLYDFIRSEFHSNEPFAITSKKGLYDYLVAHKIIPELKGEEAENGRPKLQTLGAWSCCELKDIPYEGHPDQAKPEEVQKIAQMLVNFDIETKEEPKAKMSDAYVSIAERFTFDPQYYVWRDASEKIVSIASLNTSGKYPRIGRVFTDESARGKAYAKMLVHYLTADVLRGGKVAMLYTDYDYKPSNRCYQGVGYKLNRTLVKFMPSLQGKIYDRSRD